MTGNEQNSHTSQDDTSINTSTAQTHNGVCWNKLRLVLDLAAVCHRQSSVFTSDGKFGDRIRDLILVKAGERRAAKVMEREGFEAPFSLG